MAPAPLVVSSLLGASAVVGVLGLALNPEPFSGQSALLIAIGLVVLTVVTVSAVLLARSRWSRWMSVAVAGLWFAQAIGGPLDISSVATITVAVIAASIAAGPWLRRWLRRLPASDSPPPAAVILLLLLAGTPAAVGFLVGNGSPGWAGWSFAIWSEFLALGLARAVTPALWAGRLFHAPISGIAALTLGLPAGLGVVVFGVSETALLWRRDLHLAVSPLTPQRAATVAIPPELIDPTLLEAAGLDSGGRPLENS